MIVPREGQASTPHRYTAAEPIHLSKIRSSVFLQFLTAGPLATRACDYHRYLLRQRLSKLPSRPFPEILGAITLG